MMLKASRYGLSDRQQRLIVGTASKTFSFPYTSGGFFRAGATIWNSKDTEPQSEAFSRNDNARGRKMEKKSTFFVGNREAVGDNNTLVLNIDAATAGQIYAYIDEEVQAEITEQLDKRGDTSDEIVPHREGRAVDAVTFGATLREMLMAETLSFDDDAEIGRLASGA